MDLNQCVDVFGASPVFQKAIFLVLVLVFIVGTLTKHNVPDLFKKIGTFLLTQKKEDEKKGGDDAGKDQGPTSKPS